MVLVASARRLPVVTLDDHLREPLRHLRQGPRRPLPNASAYPSGRRTATAATTVRGVSTHASDSPRDDPPRRPGGPSRDASAGLPHGLCERSRRTSRQAPSPPSKEASQTTSHSPPPPSSEAHRPPQQPPPPHSKEASQTISTPSATTLPRGRYRPSDHPRHDPLRRPRKTPLDTVRGGRTDHLNNLPPAPSTGPSHTTSTPSATTLPRGRCRPSTTPARPLASAPKGPSRHPPRGPHRPPLQPSATTLRRETRGSHSAALPPRSRRSQRPSTSPATTSVLGAPKAPRRAGRPLRGGLRGASPYPSTEARAPPTGSATTPRRGSPRVSDGPPLHRAIAPRRDPDAASWDSD